MPCSVVTSGLFDMRASHVPTRPFGNHQCACTTSGSNSRRARTAERNSAPRNPSIVTRALHDAWNCAAMLPAYASVSYLPRRVAESFDRDVVEAIVIGAAPGAAGATTRALDAFVAKRRREAKHERTRSIAGLTRK